MDAELNTASDRLRAHITGNPMALAHAIIGDTWTQLILREAFYGVRRFSEWSRNLGIPRTILTERLRKLCDTGILKIVFPDGAKRGEYHLTEMGRDLYGPAIIQGIWERDHAPSAMQRRYSLSLFSTETEALIHPVVLDAPHGKPIDPRDVVSVEGQGMVAQAPPSKRRLSFSRAPNDRPMIERSVDIIGDYWSWAIVACMFMGVRRFDRMSEATGMAPNILSDRLNRLLEADVLERSVSDVDRRPQYRLTQAGRDLHPLVMAIHGWSERWLCDVANPPAMLIRRSTGERILPVVCDRDTGDPIDALHTRWRLEAPTATRSQSVSIDA